MAYAYVLFPGRHHLLTRFQAAYLERAVAVGVPDTKGEREAALPWPDTHLRLVARRPAA